MRRGQARRRPARRARRSASSARGSRSAIGSRILAGRGIALALDGGDRAARARHARRRPRSGAGSASALGAIVRNQVGAVIGLLAWVFVVENLLFGLVPSVGRFTPGRAQDALTGLTTDHLLPAAAGGAVLVAWSLGLLAAGLAATQARDVD